MEIENTPLYREVQAVIASGSTTANVTWEALIHFGDSDVYKPVAVRSVNTIRNYVENYGDETTVTVIMPLGDYARLIYPNRRGLQITLDKSSLLETTDSVDPEGTHDTERYSAVLLDQDRSPTIGQGQEVNDINALNLGQLIDVHFQVYDKAFEQLRVTQIGGVYRSAKVGDVIKTILTNALKAPKVTSQRAIMGVDMVDADNTDEKGQLILTHGTNVFDVPDVLQAKYGVYNSGIGSYLQNKNWFVFPLYDTTEFHQRQKTLTVLILPKRKFSNIERTFQVNGDSVMICVTGETAFKDDSGSHYLNAGNGARFTDATNLMDSPITTGDNKAKISRDANNSEFIAGPAIGVNNATVSPKRITANPFVTYSELAAKNGGMFRCVWQNSDPTLILPGMAVKVVYMDGDTCVDIYGIVHQTNHISHKYSGFGNPRFKDQTVIDLFVNAQVSEIVA